MINILIIQGCQSGSICRGGQLVSWSGGLGDPGGLGGPGGQGCLGDQGGPGLHGINNQIIEKIENPQNSHFIIMVTLNH